MPYAIISSRTYPQTKFEYALATLEEAEALTASDDRLKKCRDFVIVSEHDTKLLSRFDEAEIGSLWRQWNRGDDPPEGKTAYQDMLRTCAKKIGTLECDVVPLPVLEDYRRKQAATRPEPKQQEKTIMSEAGIERIETETSKRNKAKKAGKPAKKAAPAKAAKGKGAKKKAQKNANKAAGTPRAGADPLGREGTTARFMSDLIMAGESNEKIAAKAAKKFPESKSVEPKHVSWQRFNLRRKGVKAPENPEG